MPRICEIRDYFNEFAPFYMKLDFDNIGLLTGFCENNVKNALVALDISGDVIDEALDTGAELIVSHHPIIFNAIKKVTDEDELGRRIIRLLQNNISAICLHTNLDTAEGGVNDALIAALGCPEGHILSPHGYHPDGRPYGITRVGELSEEMDFFEFLKMTKENLKSDGLRFHYAGRPVKKLACCGGAGGGDIEKVFEAGCDTYVSADLKYDHFLWAKENKMNLIDADHFCTENVVVPVIAEALKKRFPELNVIVSQRHKQTARFY